ncbi:MAG: hypothetical protein D6812_16965 [Deltaproteobacteria bacterium]|nr:MAG: hypothetical protein D6812_16965 [Deltaproteobacteria bacterium]
MKEIEHRTNGVVVFLSNDEVDMIIAGLRETLEALEDWEFDTRTGFQRSEVENFLRRMQALARGKG